MGDVIQLRPITTQLATALNLLDGMADLIENLPVESHAQLMRDVLAERAGEAHDIIKGYIEANREAGDE